MCFSSHFRDFGWGPGRQATHRHSEGSSKQCRQQEGPHWVGEDWLFKGLLSSLGRDNTILRGHRVEGGGGEALSPVLPC